MISKDDQLYLLILVVSLTASLLIKQYVRSAFTRQVVSAWLGMSLVLFVCGVQALYSLTLVAGNLLLYTFAARHRYLPVFSFVGSFAQLTLCRCAVQVGLPRLAPHANALQLIMTLKVVALAFDIRDSFARAAADSSSCKVDRLLQPEQVKPFSIVCYLYNYAGLFTGPFYTYRVHLDSLRLQARAQHIDVLSELWPRLLAVPCYAAIVLLVGHFFPLQALRSDEFYLSHGVLYRLAYMAPVFHHLKCRMFIAWMLAESTCIAGCIGAYPKASAPRCGIGPTKQLQPDWLNSIGAGGDAGDVASEMSFECVRNVDAYNTEFSDGFRSGMRAWNRSVQFWLAHYVYARLPKNIRMACTMFVSAFWHGVHPGYYLSFLSIPMCTAVEDAMQQAFAVKTSPLLRHAWWFFRQRGFEVMAIGFLLLSLSDTMRFWTSIYFALHTSLAVMYLATLIYSSATSRNHKEKDT